MLAGSTICNAPPTNSRGFSDEHRHRSLRELMSLRRARRARHRRRRPYRQGDRRCAGRTRRQCRGRRSFESGAKAAAAELSQQLAGQGGRASPAISSRVTRCAICPAGCARRFRRIDIIVNCAAFVGTSGLEGWAVPFEQQSDATWRRALEVNLTAPFVLIQAAADDLANPATAASSIFPRSTGSPGPTGGSTRAPALGNPAAYAASKGGLIQMTRWLATTLAPDVRVNAIAPGRRVPGHPGAVFEPLYRPHAACAHGTRGRLEGRCRLSGERFVGLRDRPVPGGRRRLDRRGKPTANHAIARIPEMLSCSKCMLPETAEATSFDDTGILQRLRADRGSRHPDQLGRAPRAAHGTGRAIPRQGPLRLHRARIRAARTACSSSGTWCASSA